MAHALPLPLLSFSLSVSLPYPLFLIARDMQLFFVFVCTNACYLLADEIEAYYFMTISDDVVSGVGASNQLTTRHNTYPSLFHFVR
jgi:hypothetical protein